MIKDQEWSFFVGPCHWPWVSLWLEAWLKFSQVHDIVGRHIDMGLMAAMKKISEHK